MTKQLDRVFIGKGEYVRADEAVKTVMRLQTQLAKAREVLDHYREAVNIDVKMEGPRFMGANLSALKRAWEADLAALAQEGN